MNNNNLFKKKSFLVTTGVVGVAAICLGATYAYFLPQIDSGKSANVSVDTEHTDQFSMDVTGSLSFKAMPETLPENGENITVSANGIVKLRTANNTYNYYNYIEILDNTFVYADGSTPEIILTIKDPDGNIVDSIDGLVYGTYSGVSGFDITTQNGTFLIANNSISSNDYSKTVTDKWEYTITYLNLSFDQSINFGNGMTVNVLLQQNAL